MSHQREAKRNASTYPVRRQHHQVGGSCRIQNFCTCCAEEFDTPANLVRSSYPFADHILVMLARSCAVKRFDASN